MAIVTLMLLKMSISYQDKHAGQPSPQERVVRRPKDSDTRLHGLGLDIVSVGMHNELCSRCRCSAEC